MSFVIRCRNGTIYNIDFTARDEVQVLEVVPSTCQLDDIVYGGVAKEMVSFRMLSNEILTPGGVYYVGDYAASGTTTVSFKLIYNEVHQDWRLNGKRDNYVATTMAMKNAFPGFASVRPENRMAH